MLLRGRHSFERALLLPRDAAVSLGPHPHGPRAQLRHRRRRGAPPMDEGDGRAASDGVGLLRDAGRERGDPAPDAPARMDREQHRRDARPAQEDGLRLRLEPRDRLPPPRLLPLEPVVLPQDVREGHRLPQPAPRELVPVLRHGAGQRAGRAGGVLALRQHRRAERSRSVVLPHQPLRRGAAARSRHDGRMARGRHRHAAQLDRAQRRAPSSTFPRGGGRPDPHLHHPHRHHLRGHLHGAGTRPSASGRDHRRLSTGRRGAQLRRRDRAPPP